MSQFLSELRNEVLRYRGGVGAMVSGCWGTFGIFWHRLANKIENRVPTPPGKSWIFFLKIPGPGKSFENHFGPGKSWKLKLKVLESPGKTSLKVMHFSSGSSGKQAAIV